MNRARNVFLLVVFCLAAVAAQAQEWRGSASIAVEVKGKPRGNVPDALVILRYQQMEPPGGPRPVVTDAAGQAVLANLADGVWEIEVSHDDFLSFVALVMLETGRKPTVQASFLQASGSSLTPMRVKFVPGKGRAPSASVPLPPEAAARLAQRRPVKPLREPAPPTTEASAARPRTTRTPQPVMPEPELRPLPETAKPAATPSPPPVAEAVPPQSETPAPGPPPTTPEPKPEPPQPVPPATATEPTPPEPQAQTQVEPAPPIAEPASAPEPEPTTSAPEPPSTTTAPPPMMAEPQPPIADPEPAPALPTPTAQLEPQPTPPAPEPTMPAEPEPVPAGPEITPPPRPEPATPAPEPVTPAKPAPPPAPEPMPTEPEPTEPEPQPTEPEPQPAMPEPVAVQPESQPAPAVAPTPAEPTSVSPAPGPLGPTLRAYRDRTCVECRPGEWAISVEAVVGPAAAPCSASLDAEGRELALLLGGSVALELKELAAPAPQAVGQMGSAEAADRAAELLGDDSRACRIVAAVIPKAGRFRGLRMEAADASGVGDCQADQPCPVGRARWLGQPRVSREPSANVIWGLFVNEARDRARRARLTVYFAAPNRAWDPPR